MNKLIVLMGAPASGKSTYAKRLQETYKKVVIICPDDVREELYGDAAIQAGGDRVFRTTYSRLVSCLKTLKDAIIIFDATNTTYAAHRNLMEVLEKNDLLEIPRELHYVVAEYEKCLTQNNARERHVPDSVIDAHCKRQFSCFQNVRSCYSAAVMVENLS